MAHYGLLHQDRLNPLQWGRQNPNMPGAMSGDPSWGGALLGSGTQDPRAADPLLAMGGAGIASQIPRVAQFAGRGAQEIWDSPIGGLVRSGDWRAPAEALLLDRFKKKAEQEFDPMRRKILQGIAGSVVDNPLIPLAGELLPGKESIEEVPEVIGGGLEYMGSFTDTALRNYLNEVEEWGSLIPEDEGMEAFEGYKETGYYDPSDALQADFEIARSRREYETNLYPIRRVMHRIRYGLWGEGVSDNPYLTKFEQSQIKYGWPSYSSIDESKEEERIRALSEVYDPSPDAWRDAGKDPTTMWDKIPGIDEELGILRWMRDNHPDEYKAHIMGAIKVVQKELFEGRADLERYIHTHIDNIDRLTMDEYNRVRWEVIHAEGDLQWLHSLLYDDTSYNPVKVGYYKDYPIMIQEIDPENEWKSGEPFTREIPFGTEDEESIRLGGEPQTIRKFGGRPPRMTSRSINYQEESTDEYLSEDEFEGQGPMKR